MAIISRQEIGKEYLKIYKENANENLARAKFCTEIAKALRKDYLVRVKGGKNG